jgi:hypothetical protein
VTKITIQRTYDKSQIANTDAGKQLDPFVDSQLSVNELVLRTLRNGVSFGDNVYCLVKDLELRHNTPQTVGIDKPVDMILVGRNYSKDYPLSAPLHWYYNDQNQVVVIAQFSGSPTIAIKIRTVLLFQ